MSARHRRPGPLGLAVLALAITAGLGLAAFDVRMYVAVRHQLGRQQQQEQARRSCRYWVQLRGPEPAAANRACQPLETAR